MLAHYATLTEDEIKTLVVTDKWFASIHAAIDGEVQRLTQALTGRGAGVGRTLRESVAGFSGGVEGYSTRVEEHLRMMGME